MNIKDMIEIYNQNLNLLRNCDEAQTKSMNIWNRLELEKAEANKIPLGYMAGVAIGTFWIACIILSSFMNFFTVGPICGIIGLVAVIISRKLYFKTIFYKKTLEKIKNIQHKHSQEFLKYIELQQRIYKVFHFFPEDYCFPFAIEIICKYFINGRAHSMKEAINLYETEMHRERKEAILHEQLKELQNMEPEYIYIYDHH